MSRSQDIARGKARRARAHPQMEMVSAVHEAGHAVAHELLGAGIEYATIEQRDLGQVPDGRLATSWGHVKCVRKDEQVTEDDFYYEAVCAIVGECAEVGLTGDRTTAREHSTGDQWS
jgi:hypothetical protein